MLISQRRSFSSPSSLFIPFLSSLAFHLLHPSPSLSLFSGFLSHLSTAHLLFSFSSSQWDSPTYQQPRFPSHLLFSLLLLLLLLLPPISSHVSFSGEDAFVASRASRGGRWGAPTHPADQGGHDHDDQHGDRDDDDFHVLKMGMPFE